MEKVKDNLNLDLFLVSTIFVLIVQLLYIGLDKLEVKKLEKEVYQAKVIAVELDKTNDSFIIMLESMNNYADELEEERDELYKYYPALKELRSINNKELVLALAFTESSLRYNVKHYGDVAKGICGIVPYYWKTYLNEQGVKVNSLKACELVYEFYLEKHNGDKFKAIRDYKGIQSAKNNYLVKKVIKLEKEIKEIIGEK